MITMARNQRMIARVTDLTRLRVMPICFLDHPSPLRVVGPLPHWGGAFRSIQFVQQLDKSIR
jgi:hypothetical protein